MAARTVGPAPSAPGSRRVGHGRELFWQTLGRLLLLYFVPLLLLAVFFHVQYRSVRRDSLRYHLEGLAEHQARTFDIFLRERLVNLSNVLHDPSFEAARAKEDLAGILAELRQESDAFVDLGLVNGSGDLTAYAGPVHYPAGLTYRDESWFRALRQSGRPSVITGIYLGLRGLPHFTIAVSAGDGDSLVLLRSALSPERLARFLTTLEGATEVNAAVVDVGGVLQLATPRVGTPLQASLFVPPSEPRRGFVAGTRRTGRPDYAYAWLNESPWALVVIDARGDVEQAVSGLPSPALLVTLAAFLFMGMVILIRARHVVGAQLATERHEAELSGQLVQAAKLASVGELAAGIAHEINNPLAVIAEEVGVLQDALDPTLASEDDEPVDTPERLQAIRDAVFRCRDITRKLLTFVRQKDFQVEPHDLHDILDEVLDVLLGNELVISNVAVERRYDTGVGPILADRNQLVQVFVNLVKNAMDAMAGGGRLTVSTRLHGGMAAVSFRDDGCGMSPEHLERIFMPFFTTKDPGRGTGLGLSVSYTIIRNLGGAFYVDSTLGEGSTFTVELPLAEA